MEVRGWPTEGALATRQRAVIEFDVIFFCPARVGENYQCDAVVSTLVGGGAGTNGGFSNGAGTTAIFNSPIGVAVDALGNVLVADGGNSCLRRVTSSGGTRRCNACETAVV